MAFYKGGLCPAPVNASDDDNNTVEIYCAADQMPLLKELKKIRSE